MAPHVTRHGRFRRIDPQLGRPLPSAVALLGALGWGLLVGESFRRAVVGIRGRPARLTDEVKAQVTAG
ncbi:MAG: hypothetical protein GEU81_10720 [Nitriliruptorales bacterium]|nr:hypothetical protein [Nitriliruptorales bacterium]